MSIYQLSGCTQSKSSNSSVSRPTSFRFGCFSYWPWANTKPGDAHHGVLYLDEMAEFPKRTLDVLRQPIENGSVTISRTASTVTYPADFILIAAMNPCPCGFLGSKHNHCTCTPKQVTAYNNRISSPIQDWIDIILKLDRVSLTEDSIVEN